MKKKHTVYTYILQIIDNYGHGGSGITLSWGCAKHVADILQSIIASDKEDDPQDDRKPTSNWIYESLYGMYDFPTKKH